MRFSIAARSLAGVLCCLLAGILISPAQAQAPASTTYFDARLAVHGEWIVDEIGRAHV